MNEHTEAEAHELIAKGHALLAEIARSRCTSDAPTYSTLDGCWPPRCRNRRVARDRIRAVPGHRQEGRGRCSTWVVDRDAYRQHHGRTTQRQELHGVAPHTTLTDEEIANATLAELGTRATRKAAS